MVHWLYGCTYLIYGTNCKPAGNQTESVQLTAGPAQLPDLAVTLHLKQPALGNQPDSLNENYSKRTAEQELQSVAGLVGFIQLVNLKYITV